MTDSRERYAVRRADEPDRFAVFDRCAGEVVFGAASMTEGAAAVYARRLNDAWRDWRRGSGRSR
jgi:hypothetical protein